jgi:hypothetical protein
MPNDDNNSIGLRVTEACLKPASLATKLGRPAGSGLRVMKDDMRC